MAGSAKRLMAVAVALVLALLVVGTATPARADDPPATFVSTWDTESTSGGSSDDDQIALPLTSSGTYDFIVDWGDGSAPDEITTWDQAETTHTFTEAGPQTISITGTISGFSFANGGDRLKLTDVSEWGPLHLGNNGGYFYGAENLDISAVDAPDLAGTTNMTNAFRGASALTADLSGWETGSVTTMRSMFQGAVQFNSDISGWDVSHVTSMRSTFQGAEAFDQDLGEWDISNVADMANMFAGGSEVGLSLDNYTALLVGWGTQPAQLVVDFDAGNSYYNPTLATTGRDRLTGTFGWTITDSGPAGVPSTPAAPIATAGAASASLEWIAPSANHSPITSYKVTATAGGASCTVDAPTTECVITGLDNAAPYAFTLTATNAVGTSAASSQSNTVIPQQSEPVAPPAPVADALNESARIWVTSGWGGGAPLSFEVTASSSAGTCEIIVPARSCVISGLSNSSQYTFTATATNDEGTSPASAVSNEITPSQPLEMTWDTTQLTNGSTSDRSIRLPLVADGTYDFTVAWGDGSSNRITSGTASERTHTYTSGGVKDITITGTIRGWNFSGSSSSCWPYNTDRNKLLAIENWGPLRLDTPARDSDYFCYAQNLQIDAAAGSPDLDSTTSLEGAFIYASSVNTSLNAWDVSNVENMSQMFYGAASFNGALDTWDTGNVTNMSSMFTGASVFNQPVSSFDTASVTNMAQMFQSAGQFDQSLNSASWVTTSVTDMNRMFNGAGTFNGDVTSWDTAAVTNMTYMFQNAQLFNQDISGWDTGEVTNMLHMFYNAREFNADIGGWLTPKVTSMQEMFTNAVLFNRDLSTWDVSAVSNFAGMFQGATAMNSALDGWGEKTAAASSMSQMFYGATAFNQPLDSWNVEGVTTMRSMFNGATAFNQDLNSWRPGLATDMGSMFYNASAFNGDISAWTVGSVADFSSFAENATSFNQDIGAWNTTSVTTMASMFKGATIFNQDLRSWDMGGVTTAASMFTNAALSTSNYNKMLYSWAYGRSTDGVENGSGSGVVTDNVAFSAGSAKYSVGEPATARAILVGRGWSITDGGETLENVPNSPTDVAQGAIVDGTAQISWTPPAAANPAVESYRVRAFIFTEAGAALTPTGLGCTVEGENATECDVDGLDDEVSYLFDVVAINAIGASDPSQMQIPDVPAAPIAQSRFEAVKVGWIAPPTVGGDPTSYTITASDSAGTCTITLPENTCEIAGLSNEQAYTFTATATNILGTSAASAPSGAVTPGVAFVSTWRTQNTGTSATDEVTLPLVSSGDYNFTVSWGDGDVDTITTFNDPDATHEFPARGDYDITITGDIEGFRFANGGDRQKLVEISRWGPLQLGNDGSYFQGASNLQVTATDPLDLTGTTNLSSAFYGASSFNGAIGNWDVTNVTNMNRMFYAAYSFNQPLNGWGTKTANVTDMSGMFQSAIGFDQPIDQWDVSGVETFSQMFLNNYKFNSSVSGWTPSSATNMVQMFQSASRFNQPIDWTQTGELTNTNSMFYNADAFNQSLASLDMSNVTDMANMFRDTLLFNGDISDWNTESVTSTNLMFYNAVAFNNDQGLNDWNTESLVNASQMFQSATSFNQPLSGWDTGNVTNMAYMFLSASDFNQPIDSWDVSKVTSMYQMFHSATAFNQDLNSWQTGNVVGNGMSYMFYGASSFNGAIGNWNVAKITDFSYFLNGATPFNQELSNWNTSEVTNFSYMFRSTKFRQDVTKWNVTKATNMTHMFSNITPVSGPTGVSELRGTPWLNKTLIAWAAQPVRNNVTINFGDTGGGGYPKYTVGTYSLGSEAAYDLLTRSTSGGNPGKGWNIGGVQTTESNTPGSPTAVTVNRTGSNQNGATATIAWTAPVNGDTVSPITYRAQATNDESVGCTVLPVQAVTTCVVTGMTIDQFHQFTVTAINGVGDSDPSTPPLPVQNIGPLTPALGTVTPTADGYTVPITNYDIQYTFTGTATAGGTVVVDPDSHIATISGVAPDTTSVATITASRFAYTDQSSTTSGTSLMAALVPATDSPIATADGFTAVITNYDDSEFDWDVTVPSGPGTAAIVELGEVFELQVTGLSPNTQATALLSTTREGYADGSKEVTDTSLKAALTPTFDDTVPTADGFTARISNYDDFYTWAATLPAESTGTVEIVYSEETGYHTVTVTGLDPDVTVTATVTTTEQDSVQGSAEVTDTALLAARVPVLGIPTPTADGFEVTVENFDGDWTWSGTADEGGVVAVAAGVATITGVEPATAVAAEIIATRTGYATGTTPVDSTSLNAALVPILGDPVRTPDGYTVPITNFDDSEFAWSAVSDSGAASIVGSGVNGSAVVTGLTPNDATTMTVSATREGYATGSQEVTASSLNAKLLPTVDTPVATSDGFTALITNYNTDYQWSAGIVDGDDNNANIVEIGEGHYVVVTGLDPETTVTATVTTTRATYAPGTTEVPGTSLNGQLDPTFDAPVRTADGFTAVITNYNGAFTWGATVDGGTAAVVADGEDFVVEVTGFGADATVTATVTTTRSGYTPGTGTVEGTSLLAALVPAIDPAVGSADGYRAQITNYDADPSITWSATIADEGPGSAEIINVGDDWFVEVTGLDPAESSTATVTTAITDHANGSAPVTGAALGEVLVPTFDPSVRTVDGFTAVITNYDPLFTWTATSTEGAAEVVASGEDFVVEVTGLDAGEFATATVTTTRTDFATGEGTADGTALLAAYLPTVDAAVATPDGFRAEVTNYDANYNWAAAIAGEGAGEAAFIEDDGSYYVEVTGLDPATETTANVTTTRTDYAPGSSPVTGSSLGAKLIPTFGSPVRTDGGFTVQITNFGDAAPEDFAVTSVTSIPGDAPVGCGTECEISEAGVVTVDGLDDGATALLTVGTARTGYEAGSGSVQGTALDAALTPVLAAPVSTPDGFTSEITNYSGSYTWNATIVEPVPSGATADVVADGEDFVVLVAGLAPLTTVTVEVAATNSESVPGSSQVEGASLAGPLNPTFAEPVATADGFRAQITNYSTDYQWFPGMADGEPGAANIAQDGSDYFVVVTGLNAETTATAVVSTTRDDFAPGSGTSTGTSLAGALTPTFDAPVPTDDGFTAVISNYSGAFDWEATVPSGEADVVEVGETHVVSVSGLGANDTVTATVTTEQAGFVSGSNTVEGTSLLVAYVPEMDAAVATPDGFRSLISNHDGLYTWSATMAEGSPGSAAVVEDTESGEFYVVVTGLAPGIEATATATTIRAGYASGSAPTTGTSLLAALEPTFGPVVRSSEGFSAVITNYDVSYTWTESATAGSASITEAGSVYSITVTGLASGGAFSTATVNAARADSVTGSSAVTGRSTLAELTPEFAPAVRGVHQFTAQITNYDPDYDWSVITTAGVAEIVPVTVGEETEQVVTVTGLTDGEAAIATVTAAVPDSEVAGSNTVSSSALNAALVPEFGAAVPADGEFSVPIDNYDANFEWDLSATAGTPEIVGTELVVSDLNVGQSSTVTVTTTQEGYRDGSSDAEGLALMEALDPIFGPMVSGDGEFTVPITNYDNSYEWTSNHGTVGSDGVLVVSGLADGDGVVATVTTTKAGYLVGSNSVGGSALNAALVPEFGAVTALDGGFQVVVENYDETYTWTLTPTAGSAEIDASGSPDLLVVTGLGVGESATVTVDTTRSGYLPGSNNTTGSSLAAALDPTFGPVTATADGFTAEVTNFDPAFTYDETTTAGTVELVIDELTAEIVVTGLESSEPATVTLDTDRDGHFDGTGEVSGRAILGQLNPTFDTPVREVGGFTIEITNYDSDWTWDASATVGAADLVVADATHASVVVTGLTDGQASTVTVTTDTPQDVTGEGSETSSALSGALTPVFGDSVPNDGGFTAPITNYDSEFEWDPQATAGSATIDDENDLLVVTGLGVGENSTITVTTEQEGYREGSAETSGISTQAALEPAFGDVEPQDGGFTIPITNYDPDFDWSLDTAAENANIVASGDTAAIVVTGLADGETVALTVNTSQSPAYFDGSSDSSGTSLREAYDVQLSDTPVAGNRSFTVVIENYDGLYTWSADATVGDAAVEFADDEWVAVVTGLEPEQQSTVTVTASNPAYKTGSAEETGAAATGGQLTPELEPAVPSDEGFTAEILNYDPDFTWSATSTLGTAEVVVGESSNYLAVSGVDAFTDVSATVTTTRTSYDAGTATVSTKTLKAKRDPILVNESRLNQAFTVEISNFSSSYVWTAESTIGDATVNDQGLVRVTGLQPGQVATLTVMSNRDGYEQGSAQISAEPMSAPLVPAFSAVTPTTGGFTTQITNYNPSFTWSAAGSPGQASINGSGLVTVTGLGEGAGSTVSVTTARTDYLAGTASVAGQASVYIPPATPPSKPVITKHKVKKKKVLIWWTAQSGSPITAAEAVCKAKGSKQKAAGRGAKLKVSKLTPGKKYKCFVQVQNVFGKSKKSKKIKFKAK